MSDKRKTGKSSFRQNDLTTDDQRSRNHQRLQLIKNEVERQSFTPTNIYFGQLVEKMTTNILVMSIRRRRLRWIAGLNKGECWFYDASLLDDWTPDDSYVRIFLSSAVLSQHRNRLPHYSTNIGNRRGTCAWTESGNGEIIPIRPREINLECFIKNTAAINASQVVLLIADRRAHPDTPDRYLEKERSWTFGFPMRVRKHETQHQVPWVEIITWSRFFSRQVHYSRW